MKQKPGPKPLPAGMIRNRRACASLTDSQHKAYWSLGGHDWLRSFLDKFIGEKK